MSIPYRKDRMGGGVNSFKKLNYLESTGVQWIDPGIGKLNYYHRLVINYENYVRNYAMIIMVYSSGGMTRLLFANEGVLSQVLGVYGAVGEYSKKIEFGLKNNSYIYSVDDKLVTDFGDISSRWTLSSGNLILLPYGNNLRASMKIMNVRIIDGRTESALIDFIPVLWHKGVPYIDGNTNQQVIPTAEKPGMYDKVSKRLYVNQGTEDDFLYG